MPPNGDDLAITSEGIEIVAGVTVISNIEIVATSRHSHHKECFCDTFIVGKIESSIAEWQKDIVEIQSLSTMISHIHCPHIEVGCLEMPNND